MHFVFVFTPAIYGGGKRARNSGL